MSVDLSALDVTRIAWWHGDSVSLLREMDPPDLVIEGSQIVEVDLASGAARVVQTAVSPFIWVAEYGGGALVGGGFGGETAYYATFVDFLRERELCESFETPRASGVKPDGSAIMCFG